MAPVAGTQGIAIKERSIDCFNKVALDTPFIFCSVGMKYHISIDGNKEYIKIEKKEYIKIHFHTDLLQLGFYINEIEK